MLAGRRGTRARDELRRMLAFGMQGDNASAIES